MVSTKMQKDKNEAYLIILSDGSHHEQAQARNQFLPLHLNGNLAEPSRQLRVCACHKPSDRSTTTENVMERVNPHHHCCFLKQTKILMHWINQTHFHIYI